MSDAGRRAGLAALVRFATATSTSTLADNTVDTKSQSLSTIEKENATEVNKNQPEEGNTEVGEARHKQKADSNSNTNITVGKIVEMNSGTNCAIDLTESSDEDAKDSGVHLSDKVTANNHVGNSKRPGTPSIAVEYRKKDTKGSTKRSLAESPNNASMKKQRNCGSGSKPATNQASVYNNIEVAQPSAKTHELVWARKWTTPESCNANNFEAVDLKVLSYNVDKDAPHVADRMRAIADIIQHENLDAALLQELTIPSLDAMETALEKTSYRLLFDPKLVITYLKVQGGYFNAIVVNTATLKVREQSKCLYEFPGSCMGRHVLVVDVTTHTGGAARLMTSHLESLA
ncbi:hypothetical protein SARC_09972 [Sphaeroforma arctica JP610]|uniref:Endonuclease/exonuclease/phosphatase domain-containing protein n=1 Tax=Sphaeroforma arctica JP610 TaxID=667725 RepID=A0A0L0FLC5_9EUKA|nr:hypothetical protein SARC_09972 [Sphaeroforma arctica JP610]KNC77569.1 hypothetical protein SARC_09972 [Sphaeroforma arctica JP610]|eukprot:XP_014151471.1 hypothetical protein SARC_09972 [Sphaeroforma arctica JP610]